jgi:hypothetical protein
MRQSVREGRCSAVGCADHEPPCGAFSRCPDRRLCSGEATSPARGAPTLRPHWRCRLLARTGTCTPAGLFVGFICSAESARAARSVPLRYGEQSRPSLAEAGVRRCRSHHWTTLKAARALTCRMQLQCLDRIKSCGRMTWKDCKVGSCPNTSHCCSSLFLACAAAGQRSMQSDVGELEDATGWDRALHMRFRIALQGDSGPACPRFDGARLT